ncbi:LysR family transcriptional regulator substrate-binding protein [Streptomyces sp. NPDC056373]|uniref:LysR family transcriptional regulator substrate-binding protein n=1 Tax=Streptomyces sp. NPDC056373 TaxID=3345798 RepID=UPI0035D96648
MPAGLRSQTLLDEELVLVAEAGRPLMSDDSPSHWSEPAGTPLISGRPGLANREAREALFAGRSMAPPLIAFETSNYSVACALAGSGVGAACVPRMAAEASPAPISTRPFAAPAPHGQPAGAFLGQHAVAAHGAPHAAGGLRAGARRSLRGLVPRPAPGSGRSARRTGRAGGKAPLRAPSRGEQDRAGVPDEGVHQVPGRVQGRVQSAQIGVDAAVCRGAFRRPQRRGRHGTARTGWVPSPPGDGCRHRW